jgi:hypothetical protein
MASRFVLTSARHTFRMLRMARAVRMQVLSTPGALGVSLIAYPLRREYWTLSAWTDRAALDAFVAHPTHRMAMTTLRAAMAESTFTFWTLPPSDLPPNWDDARSRVARARQKPDG